MTAAIAFRRVDKSYGIGRRRKAVVRGCSLAIEKNEFCAIIGPSGAGKSTLVRLMAGFERPDAGEITVDGAPITGPGKDRLVMFQETALFPWMTTRDNVLYGPKAESAPAWRSRAEQLLRRVGLAAFADRYPSQLSGGMQRRAEIARALLNDPAVLILDEPFRGLDAMTRALMLEYYAEVHAAAPRTQVFVTTDVDEALFLADRLLVMTHAPTAVAASFDVDLPRPRSLEQLVAYDRANAIKRRVLELLEVEGLRAFASSGRRALASQGERTAHASPRAPFVTRSG
jgi:NitT/TauT family transport system ATP-binding protein